MLKLIISCGPKWQWENFAGIAGITTKPKQIISYRIKYSALNSVFLPDNSFMLSPWFSLLKLSSKALRFVIQQQRTRKKKKEKHTRTQEEDEKEEEKENGAMYSTKYFCCVNWKQFSKASYMWRK